MMGAYEGAAITVLSKGVNFSRPTLSRWVYQWHPFVKSLSRKILAVNDYCITCSTFMKPSPRHRNYRSC